MSVLLMRHAPLRTVSVEPVTGIDGQGKPTYSTAQEICGKSAYSDKTVRGGDGEDVRIALQLWINPTEVYIPKEGDRITQDNIKYIVVMMKVVNSIQRGCTDHIKYSCREE